MRQVRTTLARALCATLVLAWTASAALAQDDQAAHDADPAATSEPLTIQEAMMKWTRSGDRSATDPDGDMQHMSVDLTLAHAEFFEAGGNPVPEAIADGREVVFFLTENIHVGEMSDQVTSFRLYVDDDAGPFEAAEVELLSPDPHHRTHRLVYRLPEGASGVLIDDDTESLALIAKGGDRPLVLSWHLDDEYVAAPNLNLSGAEVQWIHATDTGYDPGMIEVEVGRPVILVFDNPTADEHHFHVHSLPIGDTMRWLVSVQDGAYGDDALRSASQHDSHICDSEAGYCPTGQWLHLHANPGGTDAVAFVPQELGTFHVSCPIHEDHSAMVHVVPQGGHGH
ncbi:MAG: hypothetical protein WD336_09615 [Trueperaceae bacterium]